MANSLVFKRVTAFSGRFASGPLSSWTFPLRSSNSSKSSGRDSRRPIAFWGAARFSLRHAPIVGFSPRLGFLANGWEGAASWSLQGSFKARPPSFLKLTTLAYHVAFVKRTGGPAERRPLMGGVRGRGLPSLEILKSKIRCK